jgi:hypothetical protein
LGWRGIAIMGEDELAPVGAENKSEMLLLEG